MNEEIKRPPIPAHKIRHLQVLAREAAMYRKALLKQGIGDELADQLTRDYQLTRMDQAVVVIEDPDAPLVASSYIDHLYTRAHEIGIYRQALIKEQSIGDELADQLTRDYHLSQLKLPVNISRVMAS